MKKFALLIPALFIFISIHASIFISENPSADNVMLPLFNSGQTISLSKFMKLKPAEYKQLTGKKMSLKERLVLKIFQHHFKNSINKDGTVNLKKFKEDQDDLTGLHVGWFLIGFFFSIYGLLAALIVNLIKKDDHKSDRLKWAGLGALAGLIFALIVIFTLLSSLRF